MYKLLISAFVFLATANAAPQGIHFGPDGTVGASFGGYHASAGLGGLLSGGPQGGLHAQAGTPLGHFASAGLAGSAGQGGVQGIKYAGAVKPGTAYVAQPVPQQEVIVQPETVYAQSTPQPVIVQPVVHRTGGFNDIFNIPISALQAVNQYLNNRQKVVAAVPAVPIVPAYITGRSNSESEAESQGKSSSSSSSSSDSSSQSSSSSSSSSSAAAASSSAAASSPSSSSSVDSEEAVLVPADVVPGVLVTKSYRTKFDDIFNIPISVLRSVNNLLNG